MGELLGKDCGAWFSPGMGTWHGLGEEENYLVRMEQIGVWNRNNQDKGHIHRQAMTSSIGGGEVTMVEEKWGTIV